MLWLDSRFITVHKRHISNIRRSRILCGIFQPFRDCRLPSNYQHFILRYQECIQLVVINMRENHNIVWQRMKDLEVDVRKSLKEFKLNQKLLLKAKRRHLKALKNCRSEHENNPEALDYTK